MNKRIKYIQHFSFMCIAILIALIDKSPLLLDERIGTDYLEKGFYLMYNGILNSNIGAPYEYRFLVPCFIKFVAETTKMTPLTVAILFNIVCIYFSLLLFVKYAKYFLTPFESYLSTTILAFYIMVIQAQIIGVIIIESQDILNIVFLLGLLLLAKNEKWFLFSMLLCLSIFNRETPLILLFPISYLLYKNKKIKLLIIINVLGFSTYFLIRYFVITSPSDYPNFNNLKTNFPGFNMKYFNEAIENNFHLLVLILPTILISFQYFKQKTLEIKILILTSIPFIIIHYIMGTIIELRLFLPLFILLLPIAILNLRQNFEIK